MVGLLPTHEWQPLLEEKILRLKPIGSRPRGRPGNRWVDEIEEDLKTDKELEVKGPEQGGMEGCT